MLHRMFEEARKAHPPLVLSNPVSSIPILSEDWRSRKRVYLSERQLERYCAAAKRISAPWHRLAEVLCWSGIRISEAMALRWSDFGATSISITRIYCRTTNQIVERTKSQRGRGGYVAVLLERVKKIIPKRPGSARVARRFDHNQVRKLHSRTIHAAKLPRISIRGLRHSFARAMKRRGMTREDIRDALGHESAFTTERYTRTEDIDHVHRRAERSGFGVKPSKRKRL